MNNKLFVFAINLIVLACLLLSTSNVYSTCYIYLPILYGGASAGAIKQLNNYALINNTGTKKVNSPKKLINTCNINESITVGTEYNTIIVTLNTQGSTVQLNNILFEWTEGVQPLLIPFSPVILETLNFQTSGGPILQKIAYNGLMYSANVESPAMMTLNLTSFNGILRFTLYFNTAIDPGNVTLYMDCNLINYVTPTPFACVFFTTITPSPGTPTATSTAPTSTPLPTNTPTITPTPDANNSFGPGGNTLPITTAVAFAPFAVPTMDPNATPVFDIMLTTQFNTPQGNYTGVEYAGNWFLTILRYLDSFGFLLWLVLLAISIAILSWLFRFVTGRPVAGSALDVSSALDVGEATGYVTGSETVKSAIRASNRFRNRRR